MPDTAVASPPRPGGGQGGQPQGPGAIGQGLPGHPENYEEINVIGTGKSHFLL